MGMLMWCVLLKAGLTIVPVAVQGDEVGIPEMVQSSDGNYLLTLSEYRIATVWKVGQLKPVATYKVKGLPNGIAFHPTRQTALISDGSGFLEWNWSKENSEPQPLFSPQTNTKEAIQDSNNVQRLDISADGKILAFRDTLGNIKSQTVPDGKARSIAKVELADRSRAWIRFVSTSSFLAFNDVGEIRVYDLARAQEIFPFKGNKDEVSSLDVSSDGKLLAIGTREGPAQVWSIDKKAIVTLIDKGNDDGVIKVRFSLDGTRLCCAGTNKIAVYRTKDMKLLSKWDGPKGGASSLVMTKDNNTVITVGEAPHPRYWDVATGKERQLQKE